MDQGRVLHHGYMVMGEEVRIHGGLTVHFQKKKRRYFVLAYLGESNLLLHGYRDEKSFKKAMDATSARRRRKASSCPVETFQFMTSLKIHKVEMKRQKNKIDDVLIVVSANVPRYFCPHNRTELDKWFKIFNDFSSDNTSAKRRPKLIDIQENTASRHGSTASSVTSQSSQDETNGRDSGIPVTPSQLSIDSDRSSTSSDEYSNSYKEKFFPITVVVDDDDDDDQHRSSSPLMRPTPVEVSEWRKSIFVRGSDGKYVERFAESGVFDPYIEYSPKESLYDRLPIRNAFPPRKDDDKDDDEETSHCPPILRKESQKKLDSDSPDGPIKDDKVGIEENRLSLSRGASSEVQPAWDDDGSKHPYVNMKNLPGPRAPECVATPQKPPLRKTSCVDQPDSSRFEAVPTGRPRALTMPFQQTQGRPLPDPEVHRSRDVETLLWEQKRDHTIPITLEKQVVENALALVEIRGKVWIAGWKATENKVFGKLRVGDQLVQVNDQTVNTTEWANMFIKTSSKMIIMLVIRRLPFAQIINCKRISEDIPWGIELKGNEIVNVRPGPALESGLTPKASEGAFSFKPCDWIITEIVLMPVKLTCGKDEIKHYLDTYALELPIIVQPKDFITELNKGLNKLKHSSTFHVG